MAESVYFILFILITAQLIIADDIIQKPIKQDKEQVALIFIQGAQIPPDRYVPFIKTLQLTSTYSLWIGIPQYPLDIVEPLVISDGIKRVIESMNKQGMPSNVTLFLAGHSLGGAMLQDYVQDNSQGITGQILMGAFLERKHYNESYHVPTLTIGGELDGLSRVTRIMESYYHYQINPSPQINTQHFPIAIVKGMSHMQFASGTPPALVKERDLKPEISYDVAHDTVANITAAFINARIQNDWSIMNQWTDKAHEFFTPLINAYKMEGYYYFKPPCYDNPPSVYCTASCPWSEIVAQPIMGGIENNRISDKDGLHPVSQVIPDYLPKVLNKCSSNNSSCIVKTTSVTECIYEKIDKTVDAGFVSTSASEIRVKLSSRQNVMEAAGMGKLDFNKTDGSSICKTINQYTYNWALNNSGDTSLARFNKIGEQLVFGEDKGPYDNVFPLWVYSDLEYKRVKYSNGTTVQQISSPMMRTPLDFGLKISAGFHFCKLLSPARAMEWIYIDGLRLNGSI